MKNDKLNMYGLVDPDLQKFLDALEDDGNEKMKVFSLILLTTGLRVNQVLSLKYDDVDEKNSKLSFASEKEGEGKQGKIDVAINPSVLAVLKQEKELNPFDIYIFQSKKSNNVNNQTTRHLSRQAINFAFSKANRNSGRSITPSKMRQICIENFFSSVNNQAGHFLRKNYRKVTEK